MRISRAFALFVLVGGSAAALNIAARAFFSQFTSFEVAVVLAFPIALTFAFWLNRSFVFGAGGAGWHVEYGRFLVVNLVALAQVWVVSVALARLVFPAIGLAWHAELIAHAIGVLSPVFTSYFAHKHFSFARTP